MADNNKTDFSYEELSPAELKQLQMMAAAGGGPRVSGGVVRHQSSFETEEDPSVIMGYASHAAFIAQTEDESAPGSLKHSGLLVELNGEEVCRGCGEKHGFLQFSILTSDEDAHARIKELLESISVTEQLN